MKLNLKSQQFNLLANVRIRVIDKKHNRVVDEVKGSNRVTKQAIMGLIKFLNGEFNPSMPNFVENTNFYIPRYLALGTNNPAVINPGVSTFVTVNDTKLLDELPPRIKLTQRNTIENRYTAPYIKLIIRCYVQNELYLDSGVDSATIREAGLFSDYQGDNCLARIVLPKSIVKTKDMVLDVTWELTLISLESENQPYVDDEADKTHLIELVTESQGKSENDYTPETWKQFNLQMQTAQAVISYPNASEELVMFTYNNLTAAVNELVPATA